MSRSDRGRSPGPKQPLYEALAGEIEAQIGAGTLRPGERVPSVRRLSRARRLSITTVLRAYLLLERRGALEARPQSGFYVRPPGRAAAPPPRPSAPPAAPRAVKVRELVAAVFAAAREPGIVPLGAACPAPELFPLRQLDLATRRVLRRDPRHSANYEHSPGFAPLRRQIARRLSEAGAATTADEVVITVGALDAIQLCLRAVTRPGDTVAVESPTFFGLLECLEGLGLKALELPVDPQRGVDLDAFEQALRRRRVRAALFAPSFQNPLGCSLTNDDRQRLAALCARHAVPLIEDDIYRELPHAGEPPPPVKAFDRGGQVLLCGSFSKTLAPGLRVGWAVPGRHLERVRALQIGTTVAAPSLPQRILADYLDQASFERHLRWMRRALRDQVLRVGQAVHTHFPTGTRLSRPQGGFMLWIELPGRRDALELHRRALAEGIGIAPGAIFSTSRRMQGCLRLNCGNPWSPRFERALATLGRLAHGLSAAQG